MSEEHIGNNESQNTPSDAHREPKQRFRDVPEFAPLRRMAYNHRLRQRQDARENNRTDYRNMPEAELVPVIHKVGRTLRNAQARVARVDPNWYMVIFTLVLTIATVLTWKVMIDQNAEMAKQSAAMIDQTKIAQGQLSAMSDQNGEIVKQSIAMTEQTELTREQLAQSAKALAQTDAVIDQMRLEQRPWLSASQPTLSEFKPGEAIGCEIPIKNTGSTPGTITSFACSVSVRGEASTEVNIFDEALWAMAASPRESVLAPDGVMNFKIRETPLLTDGIIKNIEKGTNKLIVSGKFYYNDMRGTPCWTEFCYVYDTASKQLIAFERHNRME